MRDLHITNSILRGIQTKTDVIQDQVEKIYVPMTSKEVQDLFN